MTTRYKITLISAIPVTLLVGWFTAYAIDLLKWPLLISIASYAMAIIIYSILATIIIFKSSKIR
jgi:hypothetical protein